jgi:parvulin-like peptidyl-prolyl isomerase
VKLATCVGLIGVFLSGCSQTGLRTDTPVATYLGGTFSEEEYASWLSYKGMADAPDDAAEAIGQAALTRALATIAREQGIDAEPEMTFALTWGAEALLLKALKRDLSQRVQMDDDLLDEKLIENDARRTKPRRVQLRNIHVRAPADAANQQRREGRARIEDIRSKLVAGADFGEMAQLESDSQTRFRSGRMGIARPGELPVDLEKIAFALAEGEISAVIEGPQGFTLLRCEKILPEETMSLDQARETIRETWLRRERKRQWEMLRADLLQRAAPAYDLKVIGSSDSPLDAVVATYAGGQLSLQEYRWLVQKSGGKQRPRLLLDEYLVQVLGARQARDDGLQRRLMLAWRADIKLSSELIDRGARQDFIEPTDDELAEHMAEHPGRFRLPDRYRLSVIKLPVEQGREAPRLRVADQLLDGINSGTLEFEDVARQYSTHPTAAKGGELDWIFPMGIGGLGPGVLKTVRTLTSGPRCELIYEDQKIWIIRLHERQPGRAQRFDEARPKALSDLTVKRMRSLRSEVVDRYRDDLALQVHLPGK